MKRILIAATSIMAIASASTPVFADSGSAPKAADAATAPDSGEILVTARRVSEKLQDVPVAVTAIQGAQLQKLGVADPIDLRQVVAGLNVSSSAGRASTPIYALRGQRAGDTVMTQDAPVAVYQDEVLISPPAGGNLGLFDLENVQVLKGPQGTLFGRNTTGGAVLYTSAKPTSRFEGSLKVGYGNYNDKLVDAVLNVPVNEQVRLRGALEYHKNDGFGKILSGPSAGEGTQSRDDISLRFSAAIDPSDSVNSLTTVSYADAKDGAAAFNFLDTPRPGGYTDLLYNTNYLNSVSGGYLPDNTGVLSAAIAQQKAQGPYNTNSSQTQGYRTKVLSINNTITVNLSNNLVFKNIFGYRRLRYIDRQDYTGVILPILATSNQTRSDNFTEEAQFQGHAFDDKLDYIAGIYYLSQTGLDGSGVPGLSPADGQVATIALGGAPGLQYGNIQNKSFSGFGQLGYKITDTLKLNGGLRYSVDQRAVQIYSGNLGVSQAGVVSVISCNFTDSSGNPLPSTFADCHHDNQHTFAEPSWQLGLDWKVDKDTLTYITHRHSYRSGGFNLRANVNAFVDDYFKPEIVNDLELGLKRTWNLGNEVEFRSNLAAYYQWYSNIQRNVSTVSDGQIGNITQNAAKAHIYGLEAELELRFGSLARLSFNYAYTNPKYDDYPTFAPVLGVPNQPDNYKSYSFQYIPKHQINGSLIVTPKIGDFGDFSFTANIYYQSFIYLSDDYESYATLEHRITPAATAALPTNLVFGQKGYALVNLRADLQKIAGSNFSAGIWMRNAFDKRYVDSGALFQDSLGLAVGIYGAPRTFGGDVSFKF